MSPRLSRPIAVGPTMPPPLTLRLMVQSLGACVNVVGYGGVEPIALKMAPTLRPGLFPIFSKAANTSVGGEPAPGVAAAKSGAQADPPSEFTQGTMASARAYSLP